MRLVSVFFVACLALPAAAEEAPASLLILDFKHEKGDEQTARLLNDLVATAAERTSSLTVITGADIANVIALEAEKEALGCDDTSASCLAEVAGAMGADKSPEYHQAVGECREPEERACEPVSGVAIGVLDRSGGIGQGLRISLERAGHRDAEVGHLPAIVGERGAGAWRAGL